MANIGNGLTTGAGTEDTSALELSRLTDDEKVYVEDRRASITRAPTQAAYTGWGGRKGVIGYGEYSIAQEQENLGQLSNPVSFLTAQDFSGRNQDDSVSRTTFESDVAFRSRNFWKETTATGKVWNWGDFKEGEEYFENRYWGAVATGNKAAAVVSGRWLGANRNFEDPGNGQHQTALTWREGDEYLWSSRFDADRKWWLDRDAQRAVEQTSEHTAMIAKNEAAESLRKENEVKETARLLELEETNKAEALALKLAADEKFTKDEAIRIAREENDSLLKWKESVHAFKQGRKMSKEASFIGNSKGNQRGRERDTVANYLNWLAEEDDKLKAGSLLGNT